MTEAAMIDASDFQVSAYGLIQALVIGALLFLVLRLVQKGLRLPLFPAAYRRSLVRIFPALEAFIWLVFAFWSLYAVIRTRYYATLAWLAVLVIALVWISWFALRDYFAGLILKIHDDYEENQHLRVRDIEGTILKMGLLDVEIEQENSDKVKVPYSRILGEIHWKGERDEGGNYHKFAIRIPRNISIDSILEKLRLSVLNSPWAASNKEPCINVISSTEKEVNCEVGVYALNSDYFYVLERDIKRQMSG